MSIEAVIEAERERYVAFYMKTKASVLSARKEVAGELLIAIDNESIPYPYRYVRADIVSKGEDGQAEVNEVRLDVDPGFESRRYDFGDFQVDVYPFTWSNVQIVFNNPPQDVQQIEGWITRWLDIEDRGTAAHDGLSGAIHSFSQIESNGQWWFQTADFGTAPTDALIEFIELIASQGVSHIVLKAG